MKPLVPTLIASHDLRISKDKDFQYLIEDIAELKTLRNKNLISLNEIKRRKEREVQELRLAARDKNSDADKSAKTSDKKVAIAKNSALQDDGLQSSERNINSDLEMEKLRKNTKDILLNEAANILSDEVGLLKGTTKLAANVLPKVDVH